MFIKPADSKNITVMYLSVTNVEYFSYGILILDSTIFIFWGLITVLFRINVDYFKYKNSLYEKHKSMHHGYDLINQEIKKALV